MQILLESNLVLFFTISFLNDKCKYKELYNLQLDINSLGITMDLASVWNVYENSFLTTLFWPQDSSSDVYENMWIGLLYNFVSKK